MIGYTKDLIFGWVKFDVITGEILKIYGEEMPEFDYTR